MTKIYKPTLFIYWGFITFLALVPVQKSPELFLFSDKLIHFISFFILIFLFDKSFKKPLSIFSLGLLFSYGVFLEFAQSLTPTRSPELLDLLADSIGLLVYYVLAPKFREKIKK